MSDGERKYLRGLWHESHASWDRTGETCGRCGATRGSKEALDFCTVVKANRDATPEQIRALAASSAEPQLAPEHPNDRVGKWLSAALDDPSVCAEMKADINAWFASLTPPPDLFPGNRKEFPVFTGLLMYFPNACAAVARCSFVMNEQHNPGEPMHWAQEKSIGTGDEAVRHLMDSAAGTPPQVVDIDGTPMEVDHAANAAWRAMEYLERLIMKQRK